MSGYFQANVYILSRSNSCNIYSIVYTIGDIDPESYIKTMTLNLVSDGKFWLAMESYVWYNSWYSLFKWTSRNEKYYNRLRQIMNPLLIWIFSNGVSLYESHNFHCSIRKLSFILFRRTHFFKHLVLVCMKWTKENSMKSWANQALVGTDLLPSSPTVYS